MSILDQLMEDLGDIFLDGEIQFPTRVWITVSHEAILDVVQTLKTKFGVSSVSMITGLETSEGIEVLYHFTRVNEVQLDELLTVKVHVPHEDPTLASISSMMPSALVYESELQNSFKIDLTGMMMPHKE
jgi:Ni,Fe-hydrogenase III component G